MDQGAVMVDQQHGGNAAIPDIHRLFSSIDRDQRRGEEAVDGQQARNAVVDFLRDAGDGVAARGHGVEDFRQRLSRERGGQAMPGPVAQHEVQYASRCVRGRQQIATESISRLQPPFHAGQIQIPDIRQRIYQMAGDAFFVFRDETPVSQFFVLYLQLALGRNAALETVQLGDQDVDLQRLGEVIVGAGFQAGDGVVRFRQRRQDDYRHPALQAHGLDDACGLDAPHLGHHHIHQHQIRRMGAELLHRRATIFRQQAAVPQLRRDPRQQHAVEILIVSDQNGETQVGDHG
ncbi:hypothetical protein GALL_391690 [mine drainage metagenome]|uniref:Uncharacterized protein n=1 Tax=mine drainage metagenome TaxID=410659 RepID=A0A1J5QGK8_9ZZZZ